MLTLAEELLLLAYDDEKGKVVSRASLQLTYGLSGAILLELLLAKKIRLRDDLKVAVSDTNPPQDEILAEGLACLRQSKRDRKMDHWVQSLATKIAKLSDRLLARLVEKGILKEVEGKVLWVFTVSRYPTDDPRAEQDVRKRIRSTVLENRKADTRTVLLLSLVEACDLIPELFAKQEVKQAKATIKRLTEEEPVGAAIDNTVQAIQMALMAAISASTITTMTSAR